MERNDPAFAEYNYTSLISEISAIMQQYLDELYAPYNLKGLQHAFLTVICRNPGIPQKKLQTWFTIDASNITRNLMLLEKEQLITRKPSESDKRNLLLFPTEKAASIYDDICKLYFSAETQLTKGFSKEECRQLTDFLKRMKDNLTGRHDVH